MTNVTSQSPLSRASLSAFAVTGDADRSRAFYQGVLGLKLVSEDPYGMMFSSGGIMLRVQKCPGHTPPPYTMIGWNVPDIEGSVKRLQAVGVTMERFGWFKQDELGIATFPEGAKVAWFKDPDRNILSLAQAPRLPQQV